MRWRGSSSHRRTYLNQLALTRLTSRATRRAVVPGLWTPACSVVCPRRYGPPRHREVRSAGARAGVDCDLARDRHRHVETGNRGDSAGARARLSRSSGGEILDISVSTAPIAEELSPGAAAPRNLVPSVPPDPARSRWATPGTTHLTLYTVSAGCIQSLLWLSPSGGRSAAPGLPPKGGSTELSEAELVHLTRSWPVPDERRTEVPLRVRWT